MTDPLDMTLRALLERVLSERAPAADPDPWIDAATCPVGWRHVLQAAQRGELEASRVGRKVLVRRSELDRWLSMRRIETRSAESKPVEPPNAVAHLLRREGYTRRRA